MTRCLIVDDSTTIRKAIRKVINNFAFQIEEAENGLVALEACRRELPDVILLDWNMPVMSGIEFLEQLRKEDFATQPQVIFCTTENDMQKIVTAMENGANEYIMKPFTEEIIREKFEILGIA